MKEIWKDIEGYEGLYQINNLGSIINLISKKILNQCVGNHGYMVVTLRKNKLQKTLLVHRLVAKTFIQNPENKPCVNHLDTIKSNNTLDNLQWVTYSENMEHAVLHNLQKSPRYYLGKFGIEHNKSMPVNQLNMNGEFINKFYSINEASRNTGVSTSSIHGCCSKKYNSRCGYKWEYCN